MATYTPMIQQYLQVKAGYQDAFLFFRLGDFYEMFFDDAIRASQELEITLTSREGGGDGKIPMCGVPHHSVANYIESLIEKGYKVAICEQTEDPRQAKGVVKREVVQLITPGTMMEGRGLSEKENNYLASITVFTDGTYGFAYNDLSTGESRVSLLTGSFDEVLNELSISGAKEVVVATTCSEELQRKIRERSVVTLSFEDDVAIPDFYKPLLRELDEEKLRQTIARLLNYLYRTQKRSLDHLQAVSHYQVQHYMKIDYYSKRNLELTETIRSKGRKGSLLWLLDETKTAMGGRLLKQWIDRPLINKGDIEHRHALVDTFLTHYFERQDLREKLTEVYDLERLSGRVAFGNVNARDLVQLKRSLWQIPGIKQLIADLPLEKAAEIAEKLDPCEAVTDLLERALVENPPISLKEGNIIQDGYHEELDRYRDASRNGKTWIAQLERQEREKTGIKSLKIGYNRVFGYYIEITRANLHLLENDQYERKQTLSNAERFITPELKEKEALILQAQEKIVEIEYELFTEIREKIKEYIPNLQSLAKKISELDCLQCFATVSEERHYVKPQFSDERRIHLIDARHPVVEKVMNAQEYVPNDCLMDSDREILLITGPNMSGKSTYMRQVALTAILAQIGCYVPASEAVLPIFDQVFTRIGAADDLISGQSTFMVEMLEAKNAITNATESSLILFDEIGRGTSTYDGMALAQAMIEYIHQRIGAKTLFSTHYHELTVLDESLDRLKNVHVTAVEQDGKVVFLHKINEGAADKSYGIHVAQLAELPAEVINRANEILLALEKKAEEKEARSHGSKAKPETEKNADAKITEANAEVTSTKMNGTTASSMADNNHIATLTEVRKATLTTENQNEEIRDEAQLSFFGELAEPKKKDLDSKEKKIIERLKGLNILDMTPLQALNTLYELHKKIKG